MYAVILNFETGKVECLYLLGINDSNTMDAEEFIEGVLEYSLSNCQWMIVRGVPTIEPLNY